MQVWIWLIGLPQCRLLQRHCVATALGVPFAEVAIQRTRGRKPVFAGTAHDPRAPNFNFNVSHEVPRSPVHKFVRHLHSDGRSACPSMLSRHVVRSHETMPFQHACYRVTTWCWRRSQCVSAAWMWQHHSRSGARSRSPWSPSSLTSSGSSPLQRCA
jgi:hypothetical protein